jgi:hypothetical protein
LGVGTGENINEGPLGYSFPAYAERNARMTEALEIILVIASSYSNSISNRSYTILKIGNCNRITIRLNIQLCI